MEKIILSIVLLISVNISAQSNPETVNNLLQATGANAELQQLDAIFNAKIAEKKSSFENEADFEKFIQVMQSGFNSKNAEKYFVEYITLNGNEDSLKNVISMYQKPLMQEMNKVELEASDPAKQQEKMAFFQNMKENPLSQERIQMLVKLNNELGASEMTVNLLNNVIFAMANGANLSQPKEKQISEEELKTNLQSAFPPNFSQQMTNQVVALSMYTYKDVSDDKLAEYVNVWGKQLSKYYIQLLFGAYDYSFSKMGEEIGENLAEKM